MSECAMQDACGENCGELDDAYAEIERLTAALSDIAKAAAGFPHISKLALEALKEEV